MRIEAGDRNLPLSTWYERLVWKVDNAGIHNFSSGVWLIIWRWPHYHWFDHLGGSFSALLPISPGAHSILFRKQLCELCEIAPNSLEGYIPIFISMLNFMTVISLFTSRYSQIQSLSFDFSNWPSTWAIQCMTAEQLESQKTHQASEDGWWQALSSLT